ncbi:MAG: sulfotransferase [Deltaproteobacteria bacterium]|nr:sulfotransferase [Deltaproteobacteria bacterium]
MVSFDFKLAFRVVRKSLFAGKDTDGRLTRKRLSAMMIHFPFYIVNQAINGFCLLLDEIIFPDYHDMAVTEPVFIVGFPRSGTTYIHRLMATDEQFTTIRLWEILFAPSISQKKIFQALGRLDRRLGDPVSSRIRNWEQKKLNNVYHAIGLFEPEEDEAILMHIFSSFFLIFMFPFYEELRPLARFDLELSEKDRLRIMRFYKRCIQRHLAVFGKGGKKFLSKNPAFSTRVQSLRSTFPDAHVICMVRNPLESIPSEISQRSFFVENFYSPASPYSVREYVMDMAGDYYRYPLSQLPKWPESQQAIVAYPVLVKDPEKTLRSLYHRFGFAISKPFQNELEKNQQKASGYQSRHEYSPEKVGLEQKRILSEFRDIFEQFAFDRETDGRS